MISHVIRSRAIAATTAVAVCVGATIAIPGTATAQVTAQTLIGKAVSDDAQSQEVTGAINRFRDRDIDGCRAILERVKSNNPKLPPPGVMMAMLWLSVNQLGPARAELEETVVKFPKDPEPFLMLGDLAFQDRRVTDADMLFQRATQLTNEYADNAKRKRDFEIRCHAGGAAVAEARKQWDAAQAHLKSWIELDPDNAKRPPADGHRALPVEQVAGGTGAVPRCEEARPEGGAAGVGDGKAL